MKRGLEEVSAETPNHKKAKKISNGEGFELDSQADEGEQWTKVEKKKKKKKASKVDVCTISFLLSINDHSYTSSFLF